MNKSRGVGGLTPKLGLEKGSWKYLKVRYEVIIVKD